MITATAHRAKCWLGTEISSMKRQYSFPVASAVSGAHAHHLRGSLMKANSIRRLVQPDEALRQLFECLILSFNYVEVHQKFQIISDYPEKKSTSDRAFATFIFGGVTDFVRMSGDLTKFSRFTFAYQAVDDEAPIVIQSVRPRKNGTAALLNFGVGQVFAAEIRRSRRFGVCARCSSAAGWKFLYIPGCRLRGGVRILRPICWYQHGNQRAHKP